MDSKNECCDLVVGSEWTHDSGAVCGSVTIFPHAPMMTCKNLFKSYLVLAGGFIVVLGACVHFGQVIVHHKCHSYQSEQVGDEGAVSGVTSGASICIFPVPVKLAFPS